MLQKFIIATELFPRFRPVVQQFYCHFESVFVKVVLIKDNHLVDFFYYFFKPFMRITNGSQMIG